MTPTRERLICRVCSHSPDEHDEHGRVPFCVGDGAYPHDATYVVFTGKRGGEDR